MNVKFTPTAAIATAVLVACASSPDDASTASERSASAVLTAGDDIDRTVLPIQPPQHDPITEMDARNVPVPERFQVSAPGDAPNSKNQRPRYSKNARNRLPLPPRLPNLSRYRSLNRLPRQRRRSGTR